MTTLYDHIEDGLRRNVPEALFAHLNERIAVGDHLNDPTAFVGTAYRAELPDMARRLNDMCR